MKELTQKQIEDFRRDPKDKSWVDISYNFKLSEAFIREFQNWVYWYAISKRQNLSEDFIREFKDKVDWGLISWHQHLSQEFIYEFYDKIDWAHLIPFFGFVDMPKHIKLYIALKDRNLIDRL